MSLFSPHLPILGYHRVGASQRDHVPTVSAEAFARQLATLARRRFRVLSLDEAVAGLERGERSPRRSVVITFDDGYAETHTVAWPLLRQFGFPAAVFVTPGEVGLPGFATWEQLLEMSKDAVTIGSHTMHHSYLPLVSEDRLPEELVQSKAVIEQRIGRPVRYLSYPVGGYTPAAQAVAKQAGYHAAFTTNRGICRAALDRYALRRIKVTERDANPLLLLVKLSGYYDCFRELKRPA
jgi:peptidoglycan/xylan/chitin deacetylase (PgdA/CDA1 family)